MPAGRTIKGKNIHKKHEAVALSLCDKVSKDRGVTGIVLLGGLVRGFADEYSDVDVVVIMRKRDPRLKRELEEMGRRAGADAAVDVDLEVHSLQDFEKLEKTDSRRWEYSSAKIVLDRRGEVKKAVSGLVSVPEDYWKDRIVASWMYLQWYGCPAEGAKSIAEVMVERGCPISGHQCVNYALEQLMQLLYSVNRQFVPAPKWKAFYLGELKWIPDGLLPTIEEATVTRAMDGADVARRVAALRRLHVQLSSMVLEATGLSQEEFLRHFIKSEIYEAA